MDHQIGDYRLDHLIGQGSAGEVWLAWERGALDRPVAIKRVRTPSDPSAIEALAAEARLLAGVDHPHLVSIVAAVPDGEGLAIVMPYLAGGSLADLLEERGTISPGEVVALLEPLAGAVDALGRRGLVHGDLKPDNVMLTGDGEPVLVDAGLARACRSHEAGSNRGPVAGTPEYLDPVVAHGAEPGPRSEVYSLGVLTYECLTGRVPHRGEPAEVVAVAGAGVHRRLHSWPTVPEPVADVVESALDPDPELRPADGGRFAADLREAVAARGDEHDEAHRIRLPGITRRALATPLTAAGYHTVVIGAGGSEPFTEQAAPRRGRWKPVAACVASLVVIAALVAVTSDRSSGPAGADAPMTESPPDPSFVANPDPDCPPRPEPDRSRTPLVAAEVEVEVDVDGDGCVDLVRWDGHRLAVTDATATRSYRLGRPGDQVLFGDWDGDGAATPALYRPATGEVLYVDRFPAEVGDRETAVRIERIGAHGRATVGPDETGDNPRARVVLADSPSPSPPR